MHNLALALHAKGHRVTGSDDELYEPSKSRLQKAGILPKAEGWFPEKIHAKLDGVILGMHAQIDNPELQKARELGIAVYSFPEFVYQQSRLKTRVVIAGSHGKTSITSLILHVLKENKVDFDYLVGAQIEGFDLMVGISDAPLIVIEGDEYLTSPLDRRPKFFHYHHDIALISGIAWDHFNVFPDFEAYTQLFRDLAQMTPKSGQLIYCGEDEILKEMIPQTPMEGKITAYIRHPAIIREGQTFLLTPQGEVPIRLFGTHNLQNIQGALDVCLQLGLTLGQFYTAIQTFTGAAKRLEVLAKGRDSTLFRDFAHAPSKLKATVCAVKEQFPTRRLVAVQELHTYSSLNKNFLPNYAHSMDAPDEAIIYMNPHTVAHKRLELMDEEMLRQGFQRADLKLFTDSQALLNYLREKDFSRSNLLLMSSGTFDGMDLTELRKKF